MKNLHWDGLNDKFVLILEGIYEFITNEVIPLEKEFDNPFTTQRIKLNELRKVVREKGWWLPQIPESYGGMGLSLVEFGYISEILGRTPYGHYVFNCQAPDAGNMELLIESGTEAQKEKYLLPLLKGEIRSCFSMVEPDFPGSNPTWINTGASKEEDNYILSGEKWFSSSADGATFAIVMCVTNPGRDKHKRSSMLIVETDSEGYEFVENIPVMGSRGSGWASHAKINYNKCKVPIKNRIGNEGEGFSLAQVRLGPGRIHHCMRWIGIAERSFELMCLYALKRHVAPGVTLASQQTIQNWIAESRAEINATRSLVLDTAKKIDLKGVYASKIDISLIKFHTANVMMNVLDRALQTHGSLGMTDYTPIAYWYSHERAARIYDGPDEVHKRSVAKQILSEYEENIVAEEMLNQFKEI